MTTSFDARRRTSLCPEEPHHQTEPPTLVRVLATGRGRRAVCARGCVGRRRLMHSGSVSDLPRHAVQRACQPAVPLVDVDIGRRP
jgi:hypothetical protein